MVAIARERQGPARWALTDEPWRFDGNDHDKRVTWYVMPHIEEMTPEGLDSLMDETITKDDLSWMILPTNGFRL